MRSLGDIQPGMTLGRYEFLVPIAQGGMAAVWAARLKGTRGFSKTVAIKTMLPSISEDPQFEQMFLDEAQLASGIQHPNVVVIHDLGEQEGLLYLVMEWVDGEPLSALRRAAAKAQGIPRPIAVKIIQDACAGLHAAHELKGDDGASLGVVHRDISPQNLLITYDGVVKVVDFGVAKAAGRTSEDTGSGQVKGKPPYMSPEQAQGLSIDRRTDLFALGIVLYQLTTGKHPFRGENDVATLHNIVGDRPILPPHALDRDYPRALEAVVLRALERDPNKRFQTAAEFEAALDRVFPPTVARVRTEDVGKFVSSLLGARGEERRVALKEAIRLADERAARGESIGPMLQALPHVGASTLVSGVGFGPVSSPTAVSAAELFQAGRLSEYPITDSSVGAVVPTPYGTQAPSVRPPSKRPAWLYAAAGAALLTLGGLGVTLALKGGSHAEGSGQAVGAGAPLGEANPAASGASPVPTPAVPAASTARGTDSISLEDLAVEKVAAPGPGGVVAAPKTTEGGGASKAPGSGDDPLAGPGAKERSSGAKPIKRQTGFVPPPIANPGF